MKQIIFFVITFVTLSLQAIADDIPEGNIVFEDPVVKTICVRQWDTNHDGELSYAEAATVTDLGGFRNNQEISTFNELQYFIHVTTVQDFCNCSNLTSIILPENTTTIGVEAFDYCYSLLSIRIPESVNNVSINAFNHCVRLREIYFDSSTPKISYPWPEIAVLFVPDDAVNAYKEAWPEYANMIVPESASTTTCEVEVTANASSSAVLNEVGEANALNIAKLKVSGTINSYDVQAFRNKMINLIELDLSDAEVVGNEHCYVDGINTKDNVLTGYFVPTGITRFKCPKNITELEDGAFYNCTLIESVSLPDDIPAIPNECFYGCSSLKSIVLPEGISYIGNSAFDLCIHLKSVSVPSSVIEIGESAFRSCYELQAILLSKQLKQIGGHAFEWCTNLSEIHLPPFLETIENNAFSNSPNLQIIYTYMPNIIPIEENCFETYKSAVLKIPGFLYEDYYYSEGGWKRFISMERCELKPDDYDDLILKEDKVIRRNGEAVPATSANGYIDVEVQPTGSFSVSDDVDDEYAQWISTAIQIITGEGQGGSFICRDDGETQGNMRVSNLHVKINVFPGRWYFFCFPFEVTIDQCEYPGRYVWRYFDGEERASNGKGSSWKNVEGTTLAPCQGYAFQSETEGTMIVKFATPKFGGNRPKTLAEHIAGTANNANWNFVGNPYSSFYDFNTSDFTAPITVWNGYGYTAYRPGDDECHLQPYEAFFVQKPNNVDEINFEAERRETYRQGQAKHAAHVKARRAKGIDPQRRLINLTILNGEDQVDRTRVVLNNEASHAYEIACDAAKFLSTDAAAQFYSVEGGVQMAINERPQEGDIRLGYVAKEAGTLSISASRMDAPMMLVDTKLGTTFDLSLGAYDFETAAGTFNDRFQLRPSGEATAINGLMAKTGVCIGTQEGGIAIGGAEGKTVNVYTTGGVQAAQHSGNGYIALKSGMYVVNVDGVSAKVSVK